MLKQKLLIVIDMQNDFITGSLGTKEAQAIVPKVVDKIWNWKGEVQATFDQHDKNYLSTLEGKKLPIEHCIERTHGIYIQDDVLEALEHKFALCRGKDCFGDYTLFQDLLERDIKAANRQAITLSGKGGGLTELYKRKISEIHLIGLCTDVCVISNAILAKAYFPEIPIIVDASCCAGTTPENHKSALQVMKSCHIDVINEEAT